MENIKDNIVNYDKKSEIISLISSNLNIIQQILQKTKQKERSKKASFFFTFVKKFNEQGVQGIVGVILLKKILINKNISQFSNLFKNCDIKILSQKFIDIKDSISNEFLITHEIKSADNDNISFVTGFPLVFKLSVDMNNMIIHEKNIAEQIHTVYPYCPHFINILGNITIPVSNYFIISNETDEETDEETNEEIDEEIDEEIFKEIEKSKNLFYDTKDSFPKTILLFEKINNFPFHRLLKKSKYDNNIISSQLLQLLLALQIGQNEFNFTHYDLHTSNILEQHCETESLFLYNIKDKKYVTPTYGYYPKIIDVGSSYSNDVKNYPMMTHANSYDYGFQSQFFDQLNDVHHSLLSLFYYIEDKKSCFESLCNKIKYIFHNVPVLRKTGWKELPHDLTDTVLWKIKHDCLPEYEDYDIFRECKCDFIEIFNSLISIPFSNGLEKEILELNINLDNVDNLIEDHPKLNLKPHFHNVMLEIKNMFYNEEVCKEEILFILRELFHIVYKYKKEIISFRQKNNENEKTFNMDLRSKNNTNSSNESKKILNKHKKEVDNLNKTQDKIYTKIKNELKEKTEYYIKTYVEYDVNYKKLVNGLLDSAYIVQCIYYLLTKNHQDIIQTSYEKTIAKTPIDFFTYISRNFTPSFDFTKDSIIYYWDIDNKKSKKISNCWREEYEYINTLPFNQKADELYKIIL